MGLEVSLILALAEGNFHTRNTKKATFGTSSKMSQNRTLRRQSMLLYAFDICGNAIMSAASHGITLCKRCYLEFSMSSYRTCRHRCGLEMLD